MISNTHVVTIPDNFMNAKQVEELLDDIHRGKVMIVDKEHYKALIEAAEAREKKIHEIWGALKEQTKELARAYDKIESLERSE